MVIEDKQYGIEEVFGLIGEEYLLRKTDSDQIRSDMIVDGFHVRPISLRYMTFYQKGVKCACCGKVGTHFRLCGDPMTQRRHFNLFADDGSLFTKDHIVPKSKGGRNHVDNMQPMCEECNLSKGSSYPGLEVEYIVAKKIDSNAECLFRTMEKAVFHVVNNHFHLSKKNLSHAVHSAIDATLKVQNAIETGVPYCGYMWTKEMR